MDCQAILRRAGRAQNCEANFVEAEHNSTNNNNAEVITAYNSAEAITANNNAEAIKANNNAEAIAANNNTEAIRANNNAEAIRANNNAEADYQKPSNNNDEGDRTECILIPSADGMNNI